jgi:DNA repair protein RecO (recombination protein O)
MALYRDEGVVLRTYKLGEADRIVVLMTRTRGKVRAVAKGVRKTKSKFGSRLEPGSHSALLLYEGRGELDIVSQAESIDHFRAIRDDLDRLTAMSSMLEVVDQLALEGEANVALYRMLLGALRTLEASHAPLVVGSFFLKALALEGFQPMVDACVGCGATEDLVAFDPGEGGLTCRNCRRGRSVDERTVELLRMILEGGLAKALNEPPSPAATAVADLAADAMEHHLERRLRSLTVLDH